MELLTRFCGSPGRMFQSWKLVSLDPKIKRLVATTMRWQYCDNLVDTSLSYFKYFDSYHCCNSFLEGNATGQQRGILQEILPGVKEESAVIVLWNWVNVSWNCILSRPYKQKFKVPRGIIILLPSSNRTQEINAHRLTTTDLCLCRLSWWLLHCYRLHQMLSRLGVFGGTYSSDTQ